ncbi:MAG: hypothetical protein ACK446_06930, partial [Rhodobacterales bacterium]
MKIGAAEVLRTYARPDPARLGLLIYGNDAMRVALKRQEVIAAIIGPGGEAEMRLARIAAADLRRDPAALQDAVKAHFRLAARSDDGGNHLLPLQGHAHGIIAIDQQPKPGGVRARIGS